ncbi:MAG TPA: hypothetical protein VGR22_05220 [Thermomicrobiales bacterium]|nr:hypothetical protein [Thermomicrobiales bacterium]
MHPHQLRQPGVEFGGESTDPGINMIYLPSETVEKLDNGETDTGDDGEAPDQGEDTSGTTALPETGTGATALGSRHQFDAMILLVAALDLLGAACVTRRLPAR